MFSGQRASALTRGDTGELVGRQAREVAGQARLLAVLRDELDRRPIQVADEGEVLVPLGDGFLVDTEVGRHTRALGALPAFDRPLEDVPRLVPADTKNPSGTPDVGLLEDINGQPLKEAREPRSRLGPRQAHLPNAMRRTLHPRWLGVQVGQELATVQMAPDTFLGVVVESQLGATLGTRPADPLRMVRPHVDSFLRDVELDRANGPRRFQPEQVTVQFDIAHGASPPTEVELAASLHHSGTHRKVG